MSPVIDAEHLRYRHPPYAIGVDTYVVAGLADHMPHWSSCYHTA